MDESYYDNQFENVISSEEVEDEFGILSSETLQLLFKEIVSSHEKKYQWENHMSELRYS